MAAMRRHGNLPNRTRVIDSRGRVSLPKSFANTLVDIDTVDEFEIRIRKVVAVPARELWLWKNPRTRDSVLAGLAEARAGVFAEAPSLAEDDTSLGESA